jgi:hypothetical protein
MTAPRSDLEVAFLLDQAQQLAYRLERLSADSIWARRASGTRGALLRHIERLEQALASTIPLTAADMEAARQVIEHSSHLLENGARELLTGRSGWRTR